MTGIAVTAIICGTVIVLAVLRYIGSAKGKTIASAIAREIRDD